MASVRTVAKDKDFGTQVKDGGVNMSDVEHDFSEKDPDTTATAPRPVAAFGAAVAANATKIRTDLAVSKKIRSLSQSETGSIARLQAEFLHACLPLFFREEKPVRSLGVTSAVAGEGKTLVSLLISHALATSSRRPIVLVECDWQRPTLSHDLSLPAAPGLAELLRGASDRDEVRHQFIPNLTVIPAGLGGADAITALGELGPNELYERLADPGELLILDLPSVLGSYYGVLAARQAESLYMVVRAGATPSAFVTRASDELKHLPVEGIVLNQVQTRIPRWLQSLL